MNKWLEVWSCVILSAGMLAWAPANPAGAQEPPIAEEVQIAPCDGRCPYTLAVEVVAEVGHDAGPGMVDGLSNAVVDSSGRVYVGGQDRVQVFAPDGTLLSTFGRRGEGPGEMSGSGGAIAFVEDGVFVLTDRISPSPGGFCHRRDQDVIRLADRRVRLGAGADSASGAGPWARRHRVDGTSARLLDRALESGQPAPLVHAQGP